MTRDVTVDLSVDAPFSAERIRALTDHMRDVARTMVYATRPGVLEATGTHTGDVLSDLFLTAGHLVSVMGNLCADVQTRHSSASAAAQDAVGGARLYRDDVGRLHACVCAGATVTYLTGP